ncbi:interleukin-10 receptor subunit beta [Anaeramoeba flamelloides]|uniref:Interleukin-10 receptor subunit beta n=1 Tax=Anaeramoeba flamelloides TaxID=1746091 RepID=A0AAV7Y1H0_9EUKA|nr:interleukin-10 receptor subunit beta [Anaeramoeba flamelloides]|eukprot:Anaeramoba_flamelloidesc36728_g1_i2.p1 GENE.c36728_g1_i2~~c36728_g1_i2.p1  ORF type:complete len:134 (-),score=15.10 c36728_g1_i2:120-521(-)
MNFSRSYNLNHTELPPQNFEHLTELKQFVKSLDSTIKVNTPSTKPSLDLTMTSESPQNSKQFTFAPKSTPQHFFLSSRSSNSDQNKILSLQFKEKERKSHNTNKHKSYFQKRSLRSRQRKTKFLTEDDVVYEF